MNSGIYQIKNINNNNIYIGSSKQMNIRERVHFNQLRNNNHSNKHLQNSFNKYGESFFIFEVLEYCKENELYNREQYYIDTTNPEFNICPIAGTTRKRLLSQETKQKISDAHKGKIVSEKTRQKQSVLKQGIKQNNGTIIKRSISMKEKLSNPVYKNIYCKNVQIASDKTKRPILKVDINTQQIIEEYNSVREAGLYNNIHEETVRKCAKGKVSSSAGYIWKYKNETI